MSQSAATPDAMLVSQDLMFTSKVTGTATSLGYRVEVLGNPGAAAARIQDSLPRCILFDLGFAGLSITEFMGSLPQELADNVSVIAFGPHVAVNKLEEAKQAGCTEVLPRSRFSSTLPELLKQYLGGNEPTET